MCILHMPRWTLTHTLHHLPSFPQTVAKHNRHRAAERAGDMASSLPLGFFDTLRPGRRTVVQLPPPLPPTGSAEVPVPTPTTSEVVPPYHGRFTAFVCDLEDLPRGASAAEALTCAVFLVPQGREHEW